MIERPSRKEIQLCHYNGKLRGISNSWAALSTCGTGIDGVMYDGKELHFIENLSKGVHYHYKSSDHIQNDSSVHSFNAPEQAFNSTSNKKKIKGEQVDKPSLLFLGRGLSAVPSYHKYKSSLCLSS